MELHQILYPLLLVPVVLGLRTYYRPVLEGAGRLRPVLLLLICLGFLAVQVLQLHRDAYPLTTWTMYSSPAPPSFAWEFQLVDGGDQEHFPWQAIAPVAELRAFQRNLEIRGMGIVLEDDSGLRGEREAELARVLSELRDVHVRPGPLRTVPGVRARRCELDAATFTSRDAATCETVVEVLGRVDAP